MHNKIWIIEIQIETKSYKTYRPRLRHFSYFEHLINLYFLFMQILVWHILIRIKALLVWHKQVQCSSIANILKHCLPSRRRPRRTIPEVDRWCMAGSPPGTGRWWAGNGHPPGLHRMNMWLYLTFTCLCICLHAQSRLP